MVKTVWAGEAMKRNDPIHEFDKDLKRSSKTTRAKLSRRLRKMLTEGDDATRARDAEVDRLNADTFAWRQERRRVLHEIARIENYVSKKKG